MSVEYKDDDRDDDDDRYDDQYDDRDDDDDDRYDDQYDDRDDDDDDRYDDQYDDRDDDDDDRYDDQYDDRDDDDDDRYDDQYDDRDDDDDDRYDDQYDDRYDYQYGERGKNTLYGDKGDNSLWGSYGDDALHGDDGDDSLWGSYGDDILTGGPGDDFLHGGAGLDYAIYAGDRNQYEILSDGDGIIVAALEAGNGSPMPATGRDELASIERISFADINLAFDLDGNAGEAVRVIGAFLGPGGVRDAQLVGRVLNLLDAGMAYEDLLRKAVDTVFGADADGPGMARHFHKVLTGREAPDDLVARWGELPAAELASLVAADERNLANIDFVGLSAAGVEYLAGQEFGP